MFQENDQNNLIGIDEVISRARAMGVDFGRGNPRERLRYYTKIGLLPKAQRKFLKGKPSQGVYPEYVVGLLVRIDQQLKTGKSIQALKRKKESLWQESRPEEKIETSQIKPKPVNKISTILKITLFVLISCGIIFFIQFAINKNSPSGLSASIARVYRLVQEIPFSPLTITEDIKTLSSQRSFFPEPYLTINAETDINAHLNVKEEIRAPALALTKDNFKGILTSADLTANRTYTFPNLSGTVCLNTGNCVGIGGEVISRDAVPNRLVKFISSQEIGVSSIDDFYAEGVAMVIDSLGNIGIGVPAPKAKLDVEGDIWARGKLDIEGDISVQGDILTQGKIGIGMKEPLYSLHVEGRIQATGDICTDIGGKKCLSQITAIPALLGAGGIGGSGTVNYLSLWSSAGTLGNSIIYQSASDKVEVAGKIKVLGFELPTAAAENYVLTSDASGIASWQPPPAGTFSSGDKFLRGVVSIFRFSVPAQTSSTIPVRVSGNFATSDWLDSFPSVYAGATRKYAFLINFADDIPITASSTWRIYRPTLASTTATFTFAGQNLSSLKEGNPHLSEFYQLPDDDWQLEVNVPASDNKLRIFEILLLAFDEI